MYDVMFIVFITPPHPQQWILLVLDGFLSALNTGNDVGVMISLLNNIWAPRPKISKCFFFTFWPIRENYWIQLFLTLHKTPSDEVFLIRCTTLIILREPKMFIDSLNICYYFNLLHCPFSFFFRKTLLYYFILRF